MKIFDTVAPNKQRKTTFDLSHERKTSMKFGQLTPIFTQEVVPGDNFKINTESLIRLAPMHTPVMSRMNTYVHYFYVPNRIIWSDWEKFITGEKTIFPPTYTGPNLVTDGSLWDHLGVPTGHDASKNEISQLPIRAYWKIWNEYYRDQNLQTELDIEALGGNIVGSTPCASRSWEKDYFTSALPWATKDGNIGQAPLTVYPNYRPQSEVFTDIGGEAGGSLTADQGLLESGLTPSRIENLTNELSGVVDINDFRIAHRVQKWFERQARAGSRYRETLLSHFGVKNDDLRVQVPQYCGGGKIPILVSEVLNSNGNQTDLGENTPQGAMSGHGISVGKTHNATIKVKEHGFIMGIMSILPVGNSYQQGLHKMHLRKDKFDFYWPEFAHLGEQEVLNKELYASGDGTATDNAVFGYQSRYAEYKYSQNSVSGDMNSSLDMWHLGRKFATRPNLNEEFIVCNAEDIAARVFPDSSTDYIWCQLYNKVIASRPMPYHGTPTI